jgi:hypothetical protein
MFTLNGFLTNTFEIRSLLRAESASQLNRTPNSTEQSPLQTDNEQVIELPVFWNLNLLYNLQKRIYSRSRSHP